MSAGSAPYEVIIGGTCYVWEFNYYTGNGVSPAELAAARRRIEALRARYGTAAVHEGAPKPTGPRVGRRGRPTGVYVRKSALEMPSATIPAPPTGRRRRLMPRGY